MNYDIAIDGKSHRLDLNRVDGRWSCLLDGREVEVDAVLARPDVLSLRIGNQAYEVKCERVAGETASLGRQRALCCRGPRPSFVTRARSRGR